MLPPPPAQNPNLYDHELNTPFHKLVISRHATERLIRCFLICGGDHTLVDANGHTVEFLTAPAFKPIYVEEPTRSFTKE